MKRDVRMMHAEWCGTGPVGQRSAARTGNSRWNGGQGNDEAHGFSDAKEEQSEWRKHVVRSVELKRANREKLLEMLIVQAREREAMEAQLGAAQQACRHAEERLRIAHAALSAARAKQLRTGMTGISAGAPEGVAGQGGGAPESGFPRRRRTQAARLLQVAQCAGDEPLQQNGREYDEAHGEAGGTRCCRSARRKDNRER